MAERPMSPFLVYRWAYTMTLSILHRVTGVALAVSLIGLVGWLVSASLGTQSYESVLPVVSSPLFKAVAALASVALIYHFCNGLRHLAWDIGLGFERAQARRSATLVIAATVIIGALCIYLIVVHSSGAP